MIAFTDYTWFFFLGCTLPFLLQHHGHPNLVSHPLHAAAHQVGKRARKPYGQISLVCRPLSLPVLPGFPSDCIWPVAGWLEGSGRRWRADHCISYLCDHCQFDAVSLPTLLAQIPAQLELFAPAPALHGTLGHCSDRDFGLLRQTLLLLLQMLQLLQTGR